jgi:hypothetical protein
MFARNLTEAILIVSDETGISPEEIIDEEIVTELPNGKGYVVSDSISEVTYSYSSIGPDSKVYLSTDLISDVDLLDWLAEIPVNEFIVSSFDFDSQLVWIENCPFAIEADKVVLL